MTKVYFSIEYTEKVYI